MINAPKQRDPKLYIKEILEYIDDLKDITDDLTYKAFLDRKINLHAVKDILRDIAEAVWAVSKNKRVRDLFYTYHIPYKSYVE